jgi:NADPH:quinone reductase
MKAITYRQFGEPGVLEANEIAMPTMRSHDLLIKNYAAGVNRADLAQRRGAYGHTLNVQGKSLQSARMSKALL